MTTMITALRSPLRGLAAILPLLALASAPARAIDAVLGLSPVVGIVEEGGTLLLDVVVELPQECRAVDVVLGLELRLLPSVLGIAPEDLASVLIDGRLFAALPASFVIRREGQRDLLTRRIELATLDDGVVEALESAFLEVRVDPAVRGSLFCQLAGGERVELDLVAGRTRSSVAIEDDDSSRSGRTLVGADNAPRHPLVRRGVTGLRLVVFEGQDGVLAGLFARLLDQRGGPVAPARRLSGLDPGESGYRPAIVPLPDGGFFVVFVESSALGERVSGLRLLPDGSVDPTLVVVPFVREPIGHVGVAADRLGRIVVWVRATADPALARLLVITADGEVLLARTLTVPEGSQLARTPLGDSLFVFATDAGLFARSLGRDGSPGPTITVDADPSATLPAVAASSRGFVVVWTRGATNGLWARLLDPDGTPRGGAFRVGDSPIREGTRASVATNGAGDFVIAWESAAAVAAAAGGSGSAAGGPRMAMASGGGTSIVSRGWDPEGVAASEEEVVVESEEGADPANPDVSLDDDDQVTVVFERRGPDGEPEEIAEIDLDQPIAPGACADDPRALCLTGERYEVRASWDDGSSGGAATAASLTSDTGSFWFFGPDNVELVVKVLDACSFAGTEWVFAAGLTDLAVELTVTNVITGVTRTYFNAPGPFAPIQDTSAFACEEDGDGVATPAAGRFGDAVAVASAAASVRELASALGSAVEREANPGAGGAGLGPLVLGDGRFEVEVEWSTSSSAGVGNPQALTADTGVFWFFAPENLEVVLKVLDACAVNQRFWVFAGGLTDVEARVTVTDTATGAVREYGNALGVPFQPIRDTSAFECP
jgi:hypothetical protein